MMNDEFPEMGGSLAPSAAAGSGVMLHIYLDNVDAAFDRAVSAGAICENAVDGHVLG